MKDIIVALYIGSIHKTLCRILVQTIEKGLHHILRNIKRPMQNGIVYVTMTESGKQPSIYLIYTYCFLFSCNYDCGVIELHYYSDYHDKFTLLLSFYPISIMISVVNLLMVKILLSNKLVQLSMYIPMLLSLDNATSHMDHLYITLYFFNRSQL